MITTLLKDEMISKIRSIRSKLSADLIPVFDSNFSVLSLNSSISFNYFALGMREIVTRTISNMTNEVEIRKQKWFPSYGTHGQNPQNISTKQKLAYIALRGHSMEVLFKRFPLDQAIDDLCNTLKELNDYVHLKLKVNSTQIETELEKVIGICGLFFESLDHIQKEIENLEEITQEGMLDYVYNDVVQELDELATHYYDPTVDISDIIIKELLPNSIGYMKVLVHCVGSINATFQYGSDSDQVHGEGTSLRMSFPLEGDVELTYDMDGGELVVMEVDVTSMAVDTSSFFN